MNEHVRATRHTVGMVEERRIGKDCDRQAASPDEVWRDRRDSSRCGLYASARPQFATICTKSVSDAILRILQEISTYVEGRARSYASASVLSQEAQRLAQARLHDGRRISWDEGGRRGVVQRGGSARGWR
jgi:hypothetical protein